MLNMLKKLIFYEKLWFILIASVHIMGGNCRSTRSLPSTTPPVEDTAKPSQKDLIQPNQLEGDTGSLHSDISDSSGISTGSSASGYSNRSSSSGTSSGYYSSGGSTSPPPPPPSYPHPLCRDNQYRQHMLYKFIIAIDCSFL